MAETPSATNSPTANRERRRGNARRARRDRYWRYRHIYGPRSPRQLLVGIAVAIVALAATALWRHLNAPVGEERHGPIALCHGLSQPSCLIDGDTGRDNGRKWRLISIDAPELAEPACDNERQLAVAARRRLQELLAGGYSIRPSGRDDPNGRELVDILLPDGRDAARVLLEEGLAQRWPNRGNVWCDRYTGPSAPARGKPAANPLIIRSDCETESPPSMGRPRHSNVLARPSSFC